MADREPYKWITVKGKHIPVYKDEHGDDVFGNGMSISERIEKTLIPEDSYLYSEEYKQVQQNLTDAQSKLADIEKRENELKDIIKQESKPDETKGKWADMFPVLSDKGKKAQEDLEELQEFWKESAELDVEHAEHSLKWYHQEQAQKQRDKLFEDYKKDRLTISENVKTDYTGFEKDTHISKYQELLEQGNAHIVEMSPKEYLQRTASDIFYFKYSDHSATYENAVRTAMADAKQTEHLMELMQGGTKMYMPVLNYEDYEQEGRHRAVAAALLGIDRMPVLLVPKKRR